MKLTLQDGRYKLNAKHAIYSFEDKYKSFAHAFKRIKVPQSIRQNTLVLGYGLGSISKLLIDDYSSQSYITGIEIDQAVIDVNETYGFQSGQIQVLQSSAQDYVTNSDKKFELICHDVFIDYSVPEQCLKTDYLSSLKSLLKPEGTFLFSLMNFNKKQKEQNNLYFQNLFLPVFPNAELWDLNGNAMIYFKANS